MLVFALEVLLEYSAFALMLNKQEAETPDRHTSPACTASRSLPCKVGEALPSCMQSLGRGRPAGLSQLVHESAIAWCIYRKT
jgi:hypothetical protein